MDDMLSKELGRASPLGPFLWHCGLLLPLPLVSAVLFPPLSVG